MKRVLLKLSGEQLSGNQNSGFDVERAKWIAGEVAKAAEHSQVVIMVGGGNFVRGATLANEAIDRVTADFVGMTATLMNAVALADVFNHSGVPARALTNIVADQVADQFTYRRALSHLAKNRVVIVAGGVGRPYLTTDTAAVSLALELDCEIILKATKVDGVYDDDPAKNPSAKKIAKLSYNEAVENPNIRVMDKAALALAGDFAKPICVFELLQNDNIAKAISTTDIGTIISD